MKASRVLYEGRVQGVGFRWTTRAIAAGYDITGTVRNLPDGRVELVVCGEETEDFLKAISESSLAGHIAGQTRETIEIEKPLRGFSIVP